jgi:hypothetical protein
VSLGDGVFFGAELVGGVAATVRSVTDGDGLALAVTVFSTVTAGLGVPGIDTVTVTGGGSGVTVPGIPVGSSPLLTVMPIVFP